LHSFGKQTNESLKNRIMKISFLLVASALFFGASVQAQNSDGAKLTAESMIVDYGEVPYKGDGVRDFVFKNEGKQPLMITNAKGSCGCTVPEWPKDPIRPGAKGVIKIKYDTARPGMISKTVTITTNEVESMDDAGNPQYKQHVVRITGNVKQPPASGGLPVNNNSGVPGE
jgi:hypothetical protein